MTTKNKRHWLWNFLILGSVVLVILAFTIHYKNWVRVENDRLRVLTGFYYREILFSEMDSVSLVAKIPKMQRVQGFSAWTMEKGIFKDSISGHTAYVFVDDLVYPKIRIVYRDSLRLYLNFSDTTETRMLFGLFKEQVGIDPN